MLHRFVFASSDWQVEFHVRRKKEFFLFIYLEIFVTSASQHKHQNDTCCLWKLSWCNIWHHTNL